jgi:hypothetical protein
MRRLQKYGGFARIHRGVIEIQLGHAWFLVADAAGTLPAAAGAIIPQAFRGPPTGPVKGLQKA